MMQAANITGMRLKTLAKKLKMSSPMTEDSL
jgi:hypothetical protein